MTQRIFFRQNKNLKYFQIMTKFKKLKNFTKTTRKMENCSKLQLIIHKLREKSFIFGLHRGYASLTTQ